MVTSFKELCYRASVVEEYCEGKTIESCPIAFADKPEGRWREIDPGKRNWRWSRFKYRVKESL